MGTKGENYLNEQFISPTLDELNDLKKEIDDIQECITKIKEVQSPTARDVKNLKRELEKSNNNEWKTRNNELPSRHNDNYDTNRGQESEQDVRKATDEYSIPLSPTCTEMSEGSCTTLSESIYDEISSSKMRAQKAKSDGAISSLRKQCYANASVSKSAEASPKSKSKKAFPKSKSLYTSPKGKSSYRDGSAESIYNLRCFIRNPITGKVTQVAATGPKPDDLTFNRETEISRKAFAPKTINTIKVADCDNYSGLNLLSDIKPKPNDVTFSRETEVSKKAFVPKTINAVKVANCDNYSGLNLLSDIKPQTQIRRNPITGEGMPHNPTTLNFLRSGIRINQPPGGLSSGIF